MPYIFIRLDCLFETSVYIPYYNKIILVLVAGPISKYRFYFCHLVCGNLKCKRTHSVEFIDWKIRFSSQEIHSVKVLIPILPACIAHSAYWCIHLFYLKIKNKMWALTNEPISISQAAKLSVLNYPRPSNTPLQAAWTIGYQGDVPLCLSCSLPPSPPPSSTPLPLPCFSLLSLVSFSFQVACLIRQDDPARAFL